MDLLEGRGWSLSLSRYHPSCNFLEFEDSPGPPKPWLLLLPLRGLVVTLSEGTLLSLLSRSLHSRDMASSTISLRCGSSR